MAKKLVIVESPAKVKTIKKYLGSSYEVVASKGHVRDLPKSTLGVDIENDFEPKYITIRGKGDVLAELKKLSREADKVYLATDPDREGEAISWHLSQALALDDGKQVRITFNEITKNAIKESLNHPREIDMNLVDAQQARRVLDRLVGYGISPILWQKVKKGLSAGRVQSVALRMVCDRDKEIEEFIPEEFWTIDADISVKGEKKPIPAKFFGDKNGKIELKNKEQTDAVLAAAEGAPVSVGGIKNSVREKRAPLPFVTSTLQQEAYKAINFSTQKTMSVAQQLYERGLITYLRTDSVRVSDEAVASARAYIAAKFGKEYVSYAAAKGRGGGKVQDAHEAIRPTNISAEPGQLEESLGKDGYKLYRLIWRRFVASCMTNAKYEVKSIDFLCGGYIFRATASKRNFDGYMTVYTSADDEKEEKNTQVANFNEDSEITGAQYTAQQHFTQPPSHYTEATLVRALEEQGIGRPSTYSPTITVIQSRRYVKKEKKNLIATELGEVVNDIMLKAFPEIMDIKFTANVEGLLDQVETGEKYWKEIIRDFYPGFKASLDEAQTKLEKVKLKDEVTDVICEKCGRNMVVKFGPHGKFLACPGFPECRNTKPIVVKAGAKCPECGRDLIVRKTKKGRTYYGCEGYPDCKYMSWNKPKKQPAAKS